MTKKMFSIITASYNYENYIKETIESVLNQTHKDWEMIIVDDGSKDNSVEIIKQYCQKDSRIRLLTHKNGENRGLIKTIKLGVKNSLSDWIVFLESDDTITPDYLEKKLEIINKNPEVKLVFNDVNLFGCKERIEHYDEYFKTIKQFLKENPYPKKQLSIFEYHNLIPTFSCVAVKKQLLESLDFNCPIKAIVDYYIWAQAARKTSFYYIDDKLTNWRMHKSYMTKYKNSDLEELILKLKIEWIISDNKKRFTLPLKAFLSFMKYIRKRIIKFHPIKRELILFGQEIKY